MFRKMTIDLANEMAARTEVENVELRVEVGRLRTENTALRELVREAHDDDLPGCHTHGPEWNERAEKALTPQT